MNEVNTTRVLRPHSYFAYPHSNGFIDTDTIVYGESRDEGCALWKRDLNSGEETLLLRQPGNPVLWYDIAAGTRQLVTVFENAVWMLDPERPGETNRIFDAGPDRRLQGLVSVTADGRRVLVGAEPTGRWEALLVDTESGKAEKLFSHDWYANHLHFCPYDEEWIGFCHEGATETIPDRVWGWHPRLAPEGKCIFDQKSREPGVPLCVGHERWCFHDTAALAIAYGVSPAGPRGLYLLPADGRPARLVSEGDRDWHCNSTVDGKWAVVDTTGPSDAPGKGWEDARGISDVLLVDMATGERSFLYRSHHRTHPYHPHPHFSPDGRRVICNDYRAEGGSPAVVVIDIPPR